jgi:flagellar basal-body rod protein FlgC
MSLEGMLRAADISASGLAGERLRLEVVANNIANASSTRTTDGGPYRRQDVVFAAVLNERLQTVGGSRKSAAGPRGSAGPRGLAGRALPQLGGVQVVGIADDMSEFHRVHNPGHPDADADGFVTTPNIDLPVEMVNMITASRAYEANLRALQTFRQMAEQALSLLHNQP